jgi:hypothetical protein
VDKCPTCGEKLSEDTVMACVWQQGRCPHQPPIIDTINLDNYKSRYYNLIESIKNFFKKKQ